jgi:hypothetical protein
VGVNVILMFVISVGEAEFVDEIVVAEAPPVAKLANDVDVVSRLAVFAMPWTLVVAELWADTDPNCSYAALPSVDVR